MNLELITEMGRLGGVYKGIIERCYNQEHNSYPDYGGRGIYVDDDWHNIGAFAEWSINNGSGPGLQLDRIDNDGPYAPWNCRYVTPSVNSNNRRSNNRVTIYGETMTMTEWSRDPRCVVSMATLRRRIDNFGWSPEEALTIKNKKDRPNRICAKGHPLTPNNVYHRGNGYDICKICAKERAKRAYMLNNFRDAKGNSLAVGDTIQIPHRNNLEAVITEINELGQLTLDIGGCELHSQVLSIERMKRSK